MPASMALVRRAHDDDPTRRARAVGVRAMGGVAAAAAGPFLGGLSSLASWLLIFAVHLPVGVVGLHLLAGCRPRRERHRAGVSFGFSPRRAASW